MTSASESHIDGDEPSVVDFAAVAHRLRRNGFAVGALVLVATGIALVGGRTSAIPSIIGFGVLTLLAVEIGVVLRASLAGMLRAGDRGHRLASTGVGITPPRPVPGSALASRDTASDTQDPEV